MAASLLNTIPGRTGVVNILGKNCELKASEPKEEAPAQYTRPNFPPPRGWNELPYLQQQQQILYGAGPGGRQGGAGVGGAAALGHHQPLQGSANCAEVAAGSEGVGRGVPIYSHSTITRTSGAVPPPAVTASSTDGSSSPANAVIITNNFYTLPPGADLPPGTQLLSGASGGGPTPEALVQAQRTELLQGGGDVTAVTATLGGRAQGALMPSGSPPYAAASATSYPPPALQPSYPGLKSDVDSHGGSVRRGSPYDASLSSRSSGHY